MFVCMSAAISKCISSHIMKNYTCVVFFFVLHCVSVTRVTLSQHEVEIFSMVLVCLNSKTLLMFNHE